MTTYKRLKNQPLKFALAEFRFSPVMNIGEYIPKFQDMLRKEYPITETRAEHVLHMLPSGPEAMTMNNWLFLSVDRKIAIQISQERLIYFSSAYPRFEGFSEKIKAVLSALFDVVEPGLITRVGLRYGDLVTLSKNEKMEDLVDSHFLYPDNLSKLGVPQNQRNEHVVETDFGMIAIRSLYGNNDMLCLPDIQGIPVIIEETEGLSERMILDFDHSWLAGEESVAFDVDAILEKLSGLHVVSREAFWRVTTDYARNEKWA